LSHSDKFSRKLHNRVPPDAVKPDGPLIPVPVMASMDTPEASVSRADTRGQFERIVIKSK
jgi:hypothetical protein